MNDIPNAELLRDIHQQTAIIAWKELQRFFAQGRVLLLDEALDLVEVAVAMSEDSSSFLEPMIEDGSLKHPSNEQARAWYQQDTDLWSVVVAPYVLVQENQGLENK